MAPFWHTVSFEPQTCISLPTYMLKEHPSLHTAIILCRSLQELHLRRSPNDYYRDHGHYTRIPFCVATKAHVPKVLVLSPDGRELELSSEASQDFDKLSLRVKNKLTLGTETPL